MSLSVLRSRTPNYFSKSAAINNIFSKNSSIILRRLFCTHEPPLSSASSTVVHDHASPTSSSPPLPPPKKNPFATALKFGITSTLLGVSAAAGYATYAYTVDEVDEKTKAYRVSANSPQDDDASAISKFQTTVRSAFVTVPAKAINLYLDLRRSIEEQVRGFTEPLSEKLLPDLPPNIPSHICTLVLDLNETLVYSDWKRERGWRTFKRPGVNAFLEHLAQFYEVIVYSDHLNMYVDPVVDRLDEKHCLISYRLSRSATRYQDGKHFRDLSKLNRDPAKVIYISAHAFESCLQPENCIEIKPWTGEDLNDTSLLDLIPFLEFVGRSGTADIRQVLASYQGRDIAKEFIGRSKEHQRRMQEQKHGLFWRR